MIPISILAPAERPETPASGNAAPDPSSDPAFALALSLAISAQVQAPSQANAATPAALPVGPMVEPAGENGEPGAATVPLAVPSTAAKGSGANIARGLLARALANGFAPPVTTEPVALPATGTGIGPEPRPLPTDAAGSHDPNGAIRIEPLATPPVEIPIARVMLASRGAARVGASGEPRDAESNAASRPPVDSRVEPTQSRDPRPSETSSSVEPRVVATQGSGATRERGASESGGSRERRRDDRSNANDASPKVERAESRPTGSPAGSHPEAGSSASGVNEASASLAGGNPLRMAQGVDSARAEPAGLREARDAAAPHADVGTGGGTPKGGADRVTLQFGGEGGLEGRLRVAVRGPSVQATIVSPDQEAARRMRSEIGELQRALAEQGFAEARIAIQGARSSDTMNPRPDARDGSRPRDETGNAPQRNDDGRDAQDGSTRRRPQGRRQER